MRKALTYLPQWYSKDPQKSNLAQELRKLQATVVWEEELDCHRRLVAHYCQKVYYLWKRAKLLDTNAACIAMDKEKAIFYLDYIEPLEYAKRADYQYESFEAYEKEHCLKPLKITGLPNWCRRSYIDRHSQPSGQ